ncbi:prion-like-(Q/N-rich) domain-bearing protein 25 isoform X2 [Chrysoperla carnea]|uniref:prion-like-(Q/N-rich) domain-bearing protein 25 isoform X2 n=1 Tax=Chrysoperla carnea TaxID=189513 RepID=UPI001D078A55|nr:prion-like-(Q/N-rich) domain-bearing protein 25 isoform X2 [Chrysoperla carnea]
MTINCINYYIFIAIISLKYINSVQVPQIPCSSNANCSDIAGSKCVKNFCDCEDDQIVNSDFTECVTISTGYYSDCSDSLQCSYWMLTGSECHVSEKKCKCKTGYHYRDGRCYKSFGLSQPCTRNEDCYDGYDIEALQCKKDVCVCSDNYFSRMDLDCRRISQKIGDPCIIDIECQFKNAICAKNRTCQLAGEDDDSTYPQPEKPPEVNVPNPVLGSDCKEDSDCKSVDNSYCLGKCRCQRNYRMDIKHDRCVPELNVNTKQKEDCLYIRNAEYRDEKCLCPVGFAYANNMAECIKATRIIETHSCTTDVNCHTFGPAAICNTEKKTCECGNNSWYSDESMICRIPKGIGESCFNDDDCKIDPEISDISPKCTDKKCQCPDNTYPAADNTICQAKDVELNSKCTKNSDCKTAYSECLDNVCKCDKNHYENGDKCSAGIGSKCSKDDNCEVLHSHCNDTDKTCHCEENYVNSNHLCYEVKTINETCELDIQCEENLNYMYSVCEKNSADDKNGKCNCKDGFHYRNGKCWPIKYLGEICIRDGECYIESDPPTVECRNGECSCIVGLQNDITNLRCERDGAFNLPVPYITLIFIFLFSTM